MDSSQTCSSCKSSTSKKWHTQPSLEKADTQEVFCDHCSSSASDLAQLKSHDIQVASELDDIKYEVEFLPEGDQESSAPVNEVTAPVKVVKRRGKKGKRGGNRGLHLQNAKLGSKGKSRRSIFKQNVYQAPKSFMSPMTSSNIYFKGQFYQVGDIVSMTDFSGGTYFAQLRGFMVDQYCDKSACVTWLIPTTSTPKNELGQIDTFDPSSFILGPEEDSPRKLDCMTFVSHAPSDYFKDKMSPYPVASVKPEAGFIWTRFGHKIVTKDEVNKS